MNRANMLWLTLCVPLFWCESAPGESTPVFPRGEFIARDLDSGELSNSSKDAKIVFAIVIQTPQAAWTRLYFSDLTLTGGSMIRMTSLLDHEQQTLTATAAAMWGNTSAYFNGDSVLVELIAAPHSRNNRARLHHLGVEFPMANLGGPGQCGICGSDDRTPSTETWTARLMPVGCTAETYNTCSCMISAGHCDGSNLVAQFNVPPSTASCAVVNPPVADQFPIVESIFNNDGVGLDWAVMTTGTNNLGQSIIQRYATYRRIATVNPATGNVVDVWSYGSDVTCPLSQTQQRSPGGTILALSSTTIQFDSDIRDGVSGAGVLRNGRFIGVTTHCTTGCPNIATRTSLSAFASARNALCPCANCVADIVPSGRVDVADLLAMINSWGPCSDPANCPADIAPATPDLNVNVSDLLSLINGWGPCS